MVRVMTKLIKQTRAVEVFVTEDGKEFLSEAEALEHQKNQEYVRYFPVSAKPDLCEGRHGPQHVGYICVVAKYYHDMFAKHACYMLFGSEVEFVQGVFGSNAIILNWILGDPRKILPNGGEVIATVQDRFCPEKIYKDGVVK